MDRLIEEVVRVKSTARPTRLGRHRVYEYENETPAHKWRAVVEMASPTQLIELTARDSYKKPLAVFLLDSMDKLDLPGRAATGIRVFPTTFPRPCRFDCIVIVPPKVAERFSGKSRVLQAATYWVFPAFEEEFRDKDEFKAFWHQIYRKDGWCSVVVRWDRKRKTRPVFDA
jgi:hypothetical protein